MTLPDALKVSQDHGSGFLLRRPKLKGFWSCWGYIGAILGLYWANGKKWNLLFRVQV